MKQSVARSSVLDNETERFFFKRLWFLKIRAVFKRYHRRGMYTQKSEIINTYFFSIN